MKHETLMAIIDRANGQPVVQVPAFTYFAIAPHVEEAEVEVHYTTKTVNGPIYHSGTHTIFLIRNNDGICVAAIQDAGEWDLHWVVDPAYRGQGLLTAALRNELLPYLLRSRPWQQVTVSYGVAAEYYQASQKVARRAGFTAISTTDDEVVYRITAEDLVANPVS
ncbi:GNAT family N-acetyltransferase [Hymenobacter cavernae]|uniref:N-acetyltransferase n=1 Tax=Hymenobacter cavernae TaxID=2044852 RepID=A0ABQ1UXR3_9BACT|nr:GNAT family protein [Hymenobacter cavernae]GGF28060.1 hypothetical protein GCM10011383_44760 [Hymenobacter cavernae]